MRELRDAGYGMQTVTDQAQAPMLVTYQADSFENATHKTVAYRLRVGSVELAREYEVRADRLFPVTALSVKGIEIASQPLDQSLFARTGKAQVNAGDVEGVDQTGSVGKASVLMSPVVPTRQLPERTTATPVVTTTAVETTSTTPTTPAERIATQSPDEKENLLILGESNYASLFEQYRTLSRQTLVFPNDSLFLGNKGKAQIAAFIDRFNPATDIVSVIGCSHGATSVSGGNKQLALGRAERVVDEMLLHRVPADRIYDEGCWAGLVQPSLPSRGVILSLRRKIQG